MDFEPWWLIIVPVLFGLGWIAARVDIRQMLSETRSLPKSYFKGLNFLLNEQPDRAIDAFIEVAKLDSETTELHFALGSLFRRRGEMERAIRVHQSLLARADLPVADREMAQHELAQDYLKAGMFDRAETAYTAVLDTRFAVPAIRALIRIFESSHEWSRAIEAVHRLQALVDEPVPQLVHYHCERAVVALEAPTPDPVAAAQALDIAEHAAARLPGAGQAQASQARIAMLRARVAALEGQPGTQKACLSSVLEIAPDFAALVAEPLMRSYRDAGLAGEGLAVLQAHYQRHPSLDLFKVIFRELRATRGAQPAWDFARAAQRSQPSLLGLDRMLEFELAGRTPETAAEPPAGLPVGADLDLLRSIIHRHIQRLDRYACSQCGFEARNYYWQCPGCNAWETYQPRRLEELS
ncbi:MAG: lipopolysaccharide assembly protein LapB [Castellaniella sp.]